MKIEDHAKNRVDLHSKMNDYRPDIDGLRAVAILSVVFYHAFPTIIRGGFTGVDVFFVISGFLISTIIYNDIANERFTFRGFYERRIRRIFPALITVLLAALVVGYFVLLPVGFKLLGKHVLGSAGFVSNIILSDERGYFAESTKFEPLMHLWSLGIEEQYYIFFPLMISFSALICRKFIKARDKRHVLEIAFGVPIVILFAISFFLNVRDVGVDEVWTFYMPQTRVWELMVGSILALAVSREALQTAFASTRCVRRVVAVAGGEGRADTLAANGKALLGAALLVAGASLVDRHTHFPGLWALLPTLGAAFLIWAGPRAVVNRLALANRPMVWIGKISYPLYLWHWAILSYLYIINDGTSPGWARALAVAAAILLAWLTYRLIEMPLRFGPGRKHAVRLLIFAMAGVGALGLAAYEYGHGLHDWRHGKVISELETMQTTGPQEIRRLGGTRCFQLPPHKDFDFFVRNKCLPADGKASAAKTIMIIGDSHSASLSLGLRSWAKSHGYAYYQISSGACSLFSDDLSDPQCQEYSRKTFEAVQRVKPDVLVVDSYWSHVKGAFFKKYGKWPSFNDYITNRLDYVGSLGAKSVIVVGEVPTWTADLPDILMRNYVSLGLRIPERIRVGLDPASPEMDKKMRAIKYPANFTYVSMIDLFCDQSGCKTDIGRGDRAKNIVVWDYGHLTPLAARYAVDNAVGPAILHAMATQDLRKSDSGAGTKTQ